MTILLKCHKCGANNCYQVGDVVWRRGCSECYTDWFCGMDASPTIAGVEAGPDDASQVLNPLRDIIRTLGIRAADVVRLEAEVRRLKELVADLEDRGREDSPRR
jgi:hypothetical protein